MARYRATLAYDGTYFFGFQKQAQHRTVQGELETALQAVFHQPIDVVGAGRTDTGVHASGQVIAFDVDWHHSNSALLKTLNHALPNDIAVCDVVAQAGFHPRFGALWRMYRYDVLGIAHRHPLCSRYMWQVPYRLDLEMLNAAAQILVGKHDFATFGKPPKGTNTVREIMSSVWTTQESTYGTMWSYTIRGTAFLQHQVRRTARMLVDVGRGKMSVAQFETAFRNANLKFAGKPAPPQGLTLVEVCYPPPDQNQHFGMDYGGETAPSEVEDES
jgi:tRNA pseudouridine38-40 synthase